MRWRRGTYGRLQHPQLFRFQAKIILTMEESFFFSRNCHLFKQLFCQINHFLILMVDNCIKCVFLLLREVK